MTWQPEKLTRAQMAERRSIGVQMLQQGVKSQVQIARHLGVSEATVSKWKKRLETKGPRSLQARKSSGRPAKISKAEKQKLNKILEKGAMAAGFPTEQWTQARVKQVIEREFGVRYHQNYISQLLHQMGWSVQKPEPRALERDEDLIRAWLQKDWPRIKKAQRIGAVILFEDEFGLSYSEAVGFTWAPKGHTPILKRVGRYRRETSTMVALTITGKIYKRHFDNSINAEKLIVGLEHFCRQIRRPFIMIWDRSPVHRSKIVKTFFKQHPEIHIEYLPPYAPELNPEEYCHGNVKDRMRNGVYRSKNEIRKCLDAGFARLRKRQDILLGCFQHAGLELTQLW